MAYLSRPSRIQQFEEKYQEKYTGKIRHFCSMGYSFVYFSLVTEALRISLSLLQILASGSEFLLSSKLRSKDAT